MSSLRAAFSTTPAGSMVGRVRVVPCCSSNGDVENYEQESFEIVALLILEESSDGEDSENKHDKIEDGKVEIKCLVETPADDDNERSVEEGGLKCSTEDVRHGQIDLVIPGFVDGSQMLGKFFDQGNKNETHERVADMSPFDDKLDLHDENNSGPSNEADGDHQSNNAFSQSQLSLGLVLVLVSVIVLVLLKDSIVDTMVGSGLEEDVDQVGNDEQNRDNT